MFSNMDVPPGEGNSNISSDLEALRQTVANRFTLRQHLFKPIDDDVLVV
jgi:hypothetical protein